MKTYYILFCLLFFSCYSCNNSTDDSEAGKTEEWHIQYGSSVNIDGTVSQNEWNDAGKIEIEVPDRGNVEVFVKHDGENLLFLFELHNPNVNSVLFPEILIDVNNDKSTAWEADDWWFHISGHDCESKGSYGIFSNCETEQPGWEAVSNYPTDVPGIVNTIEVKIPFSKIEISKTNSFGMCILVTNLNNLWKHWPAGSTKNSPSGWCNVKCEI